MEEKKLEVETLLGKALSILKNLKKAPNRLYQRVTITERRKEIRALFQIIEEKLEDIQDHLTELEYLYYKQSSKKVCEESIQILDRKLKSFENFTKFRVLVWSLVFCNRLKTKRTMANRLDLALALKVVDRFGGESLELGHFLETVDLLKACSGTGPEADILTFLKIRLVGSAHGTIEGVAKK